MAIYIVEFIHDAIRWIYAYTTNSRLISLRYIYTMEYDF